MTNSKFEMLPEVKKIEACENFIKKQFEKRGCKGIEINCMFDMAERAGLYTKGIYGSVFSQALENVTTVETITNENGNYLYTVFRLA